MNVVTSKDVAHVAGTSQATVSRVFRNLNVTPAVRDRVLRVADELGYVPNGSARALISGQTNQIALVVGELLNPSFSVIADLAHQKLASRGFRLVILEAGTQGIGASAGGSNALTWQSFDGVDGIVDASGLLTTSLESSISHAGKPAVYLLREPTDGTKPFDLVQPDHQRTVETAVDHLWGLGHRRIALIGASATLATGLLRSAAFTEALARRGISQPQDWVRHGQLSYESGFELATQLLKGPNRPTAILGCDDPVAWGALGAAKTLSVSVPRDVSIMGMDNHPMSEWASFDLTTVSIDLENVLGRAFDLLLHRIAERREELSAKQRHATQSPEDQIALRPRGTTAQPPN